MVKVEEYKNGIRIRRKVDGVWIKPATKMLKSKSGLEKLIRGLQSLCTSLDYDISMSVNHDMDLIEKVGKLDDVWRPLLDKVGLLEQFNHRDKTIEQFVNERIDKVRKERDAGNISRSHMKTIINNYRYFLDHCLASGVDSFDGVSISLCEDFKYSLLDEYAITTVKGVLGRVRSMLKHAVEDGLLRFNPADAGRTKVKKVSEISNNRRFKISGQVLDKVEDYLKEESVFSEYNNAYYLWFCLVRWTGARKCEPILLKWSGIDFEQKRIVMPSPKTAKQGRPEREMPLYAELEPILAAEWERQGKPMSGYVVVGLSAQGLSYVEDRSTIDMGLIGGYPEMKARIVKAGVEPWAKIFQNLRVSRENELNQQAQYRPEAVLSFIGHSSKTYAKSYLQLDDADFVPRDQKEQPEEHPIRAESALKPNESIADKVMRAVSTGNLEESAVLDELTTIRTRFGGDAFSAVIKALLETMNNQKNNTH